MKKYLTIIAATLLAAGCQNDDATAEQQRQPGDAIAVAVDEGSLTRATGEINTASLATKGFGLFASYTGKLKYENTTVSPDYMYNQKVTGESDNNGGYNWVYNPIKYWPNTTDQETGSNNEYVSFFAYAPYEADPKDDGRAIIDMSKKYDLGDPWINFRLPANPWGENGGQVDLMYGVKTGGLTDSGWDDEMFIDQQKPSNNDNYKMRFIFRHALACIGDEITIQLSPDMSAYINGYATITISKLTINYKNLTTKGRLVLNSPNGPNWKEIVSGELTTTRTFTKELTSPMALTATAQELSAGEGLFYIPIQVKGTDDPVAEVTISYTVTNPANSVYQGEATTTIPLDLSLEGQKQGIALQITKTLDLQHLTYEIGGVEPATEPSYSRITK
jgi:hypothetical protein